MRQIFLDTETTGLYADQGDRIIEIGCVEMVNRRLTGNNLHFYLNPGRDSHEEALKVHGISNEFLRDKPAFPAIVEELLQYVAGAEIIIHNAAFDLGFLNQELSQLKRPVFREFVGSVTDTLVMAKEMFPGKRNSLDALCDRYGVSNAHRSLHGALLDAELLAEVYLAMTRGQDSFEIALDSGPQPHSLADAPQWPPAGLSVIAVSQADLIEHEAALAGIEKERKAPAVWRDPPTA
jgi:DNA polymerase-3 subunit epsilon